MRKTQRLAAYALVLFEDSLLLSKLGRGGNIGKWNLPGGGVEHSEAPEEAVIREIYEEAGFQLSETPNLLGVLSYHQVFPGKDLEPGEHYHSIGVIYVLQLKEKLQPKPGGDGESSLGCEWFRIAELESDQVVAYVSRSLELLQTAGGIMAKKKAAKKKTSKKKASAKKPGLYANIHKAQKRAKRGGKAVRKKGQKGAPTDKAFKKAKKTAKKTTKKTSSKKTSKKTARKS